MATGQITCLDPESWKPQGYDFNNAEARRFLPSSELLLANTGVDVVSSVSDYLLRRFERREGRRASSVHLAPESGVLLSPLVVRRLEEGTGFRFNLKKALPFFLGVEEDKRVRLLRNGQAALGCLGSAEPIHTDWTQKRCGRLYAAQPAILNLPKALRPALEPIAGGILAEIDFNNFEPRILFAEAGLKAPPGDCAAFLGNQVGLTRQAVKRTLTAALHGQTQGNLAGMHRWEELRNRKTLEEYLKKELPALWEFIEALTGDIDFLQRRGAQIFFSAFDQALGEERIPAGIAMHDGWIFAAENDAQVIRIKRIFEEVGSGILGQVMPVQHLIWN